MVTGKQEDSNDVSPDQPPQPDAVQTDEKANGGDEGKYYFDFHVFCCCFFFV